MPPNRQEGDLTVSPDLSQSDVDELHSLMRRRSQKHFKEAALLYQGRRNRDRRQAENSQIISPVGITGPPYNFTWNYIPPANSGWRAYPGVRPWNFIVLHSLAALNDQSYLRRHPEQTAAPNIDQYGHRPLNWKIAQRIFFYDPGTRRPKGLNVAIHFLVSRRGDVIVSAGLNDVAFHTAGSQQIKGGRNDATIGIELELSRYRKVPRGPILFRPYPTRQLTALAIILKKIEAVRPIKRQHISSRNGSLLQQTAAAGSGYLIHSEIGPERRQDPGAQFNIPQGQSGSGWDQLFNLMSKVRSFNLATDVFVDNLNPEETRSVQKIASALNQANAGSQAALRAVWAQANANRRASRMQGQSRAAISRGSLGQIATINDRVTAATAAMIRTVQSFSESSLTEIKGGLVFNESQNKWEVI